MLFTSEFLLKEDDDTFIFCKLYNVPNPTYIRLLMPFVGANKTESLTLL